MTNIRHFAAGLSTPLIVVAFFIVSALFLASPQTANAGIIAGACGGTVVTDFSCSTTDYTYQACTSGQRAYYNDPDVFIRTCFGDSYYGPRGYCQADAACSNPPAVVTSFTANPNPVVRGNSTAISWSSSNATSCTSPDFTTGGTPSGIVSVPITSVGSANPTITCTGPGGSGGSSVYISVNEPSFDAVCSANRTSATVGQTVTWNASASNGTTPYSYEWIGQIIDGLTGTSAQAAYTTTGSKTAIIKVTDSSSSSGVSTSRFNSSICTGPIVASDINSGLAEDGGQQSDMENVAMDLAAGVFYGAEGIDYNQSYRSTYNAVVSNPGGYCVDVKLTQACNPNTGLGWNGCDFQFKTNIHSGNGRRAATASDFGDFVGNPPWDRTRFYGAVTGTLVTGTPRIIQRACTTTVNVTANAATAALTADPVAVISGQSSTLTWSSTNATSCTGTNFSTAGATSGTLEVTPTVDTIYSLQCTGPGGDSPVAPATVNVTPLLTGTCAVSPTSVSTGGTATWTATPSGGNGSYTYVWSGTDSLSGTSNPISKAYATAGSYTGAVRITSGTQAVDVACAGALTVSTAAQPNLSAGSISPTSATAGTLITLVATITNFGAASTGSGFTDLFQSATDAGGSNATDIDTHSNGALGNGAQSTASLSYTFSSAGTYYVRACADKSSAGNAGSIPESNEGDNCGPWTTVTVSSAASPTVSCTVSPASIATGGSATYTANPSGGAGAPYTWLDSDGWTTNSSGTTINRTYTTPGTYQMQVRSGTTSYTNCNSQLSVGTPTCTGPATLSITASPDRVKEGSTATTSWTATGVGGATPSCTVSGPGVSQVVAAGAVPSCQIPNGSASPIILKQSTYTITCSDGATKSVTVNVIPKFLEF